ncbi:hypothetical protein [Phenylobacterium sp.]|uniref:hypothetical protein n=1 Tax=Phenylobacterium sp. TaxID=1871053 RepID=UPI002810F632|nr:hypothetical protein [Phenylobacterium sp.]
MTKILIPFGLITLALAVVLAAPAASQPRAAAPDPGYRSNMPAVNPAAPRVDPDAPNHGAAGAFSDWNARNGRPSILVFWNRELTEDGTTLHDSVTATRADGSAEKGAFVARGRGVTVAGSAAAATVTSETRTYQERTTDSRYGFRDDVFAKQVESAMLGTFLSAGARVMDRESLIRNLSAGKSRDERLDIQHLETVALKQGVKYLVEVLPDNSAASATGVSFTVKITHLPTSTVRGQFVTTGEPPRGPTRLVAGPSGFERRAAEGRATPELIGAQVAYEAMGRLR